MTHHIPTTLIPTEGSSSYIIQTNAGSVSFSSVVSILGVPPISTFGTGSIVYINSTSSALIIVADTGSASPLDGILQFSTLPPSNNFSFITATNNTIILTSRLVPTVLGGTGESFLPQNSLLYGQGAAPVGEIPVGTDGQILLSSATLAPLFATITSSGETLTFTMGPNSLNIEATLTTSALFNPLPVSFGGTGQTVLTAYGALIGEGSLGVHVTNPGTNGQTIIASTNADPTFATITSSERLLSFTAGNNSLNVDVNFFSTFFVPLSPANGATGRTILTCYGVLLGEGSLNINVTAAGSNGQLLIAGDGVDPQFITITSSGGTLSFMVGPHTLNIDVDLSQITFFMTVPVSSGGTNRTILTAHGVLIGEGSLSVNVSAPGTNGQIFLASSSEDPAFATITSTGNTLTFTSGPNSLNIDLNLPGNTFFNPLLVVFGGTGQTLFTSYGVLIGKGSLGVEATAPGTNGQVFMASTNENPAFSTITSTGNTLTFTYGPHFLNIEINLDQFSFPNFFPTSSGGTGLSLLTSYGILIGAGSLPLHVTPAGTNGQVLIASTDADPLFSTITSTGLTLTFTYGPLSLNIDADTSLAIQTNSGSAAPNQGLLTIVGNTSLLTVGSSSSVLTIELNTQNSFYQPLSVDHGGTGRTLLTAYGVLLGEGSNPIHAAAAGTNGQIFLGSSTGDPAFSSLSSTLGTFVFTQGPNTLNIDVNFSAISFFNPLPVNTGNTGQTFLTTYGVLIGEGSNPVHASAAGTNGQLFIASTTGDPLFSTVTSPGQTLSFASGPNSLNIDVNWSNIANLNPLVPGYGGTGRTIFTTYGVLLGQGSLGVNATAAGTNGQVLIGSTTGDPAFATLTSTGQTLTFTFGYNSLNIDVVISSITLNVFSVDRGGTGRTILTAYGVLLGEGSLDLNVTNPGTNGQVLIASTTGDPAFANLTSTGGTITFSLGSHSLNIDLLASSLSLLNIVPTTSGGTNRTLLTTYGVLLGEGSLSVNVSAPGTNGQAFISSSTGDPAFATITSKGGTLTFQFGLNSLNIEANLLTASLFNPLPLIQGSTGRTLLTTYGVLIGEGSLSVNVSAPGTNGQAFIGSSTGDPAFATITSTGQTITLTQGNLSLNMDILSIPSFPIGSGSTGQTFLTTHGVLIGEGSLSVHVTNPGTQGQLLIGSTTGDPIFATVTSTGGTLLFSAGSNSLNIDINLSALTTFSQFSVGDQGTGRTLLTTYGVLIGEGSNNINVTEPGTNGQLLVASATGDPRFTSITSTGGSLTFTFGPSSLNIDVNLETITLFNPLLVSYGGTGRTLLTAHGVLIGEGSLGLNVSSPGTNGQIFTASTTGDPQFTNITSTGSTLAFTSGPNGLNIDINLFGISLFNPLSTNYGGTGQTVLTAYGVLIGEGSLGVHVSAAGTNGQLFIASNTGDPKFVTVTSTGYTVNFTYGPNSLNLEVNSSGITFFTLLPVESGGTGRTALTAYGVLVGEGSLNVNVTAAGTDGQVLIASTTGDPSFSNLTSTGNTITFSFGLNSLNLDINLFGNTFFNPLQVGNGGTGQTLPTTHGVLIGEGSLGLHVTDPGTQGQVFLASNSGDPQFSTITSTGGTLTFAFGPNSLNIDINLTNVIPSVLPVDSGGTGQTLLTVYGVLLGQGSLPIHVSAPGTNGQLFIASSTGDPQFSTLASIGGTLTFTFGPNSLNIDVNPFGSTAFNPLPVPFGGTTRTLLTAYGVLIGEGSLNINVSAPGTNGQIFLASSTGDPQFSTLTSTGGSLSFTFGPNSLNMDVNLFTSTLFNPLQVGYGGTGLRVLTAFGVLLGEGSLSVNVSSAGTNGQMLLASTTGDPLFASVTSTGGSLLFTSGPNALNLDISPAFITFPNILTVSRGGTGLTLLTTYGVLLGEGSLNVNVSAPGTNGQVFISSTTGDPTFSTITSTRGTLTFSFGFNSLNIDLNLLANPFFNPLAVANGGTGLTLLTTYGVLIGEGSLNINVSAPGTHGQTLIASTTGDPKFSTITSTGSTLTFTFGPNSLNIDLNLSGNTFFNPLQLNRGGTGVTILTTYGVLLGAGSNSVNVTAAGTNGQLLVASSTGNPSFATLTSIGASLTFTTGNNQLNVEVNPVSITFFSLLPVSAGGTGRTLLTTYGVILGAGSLGVRVTAPGTHGQLLIASNTGDPKFSTITSTGNTLSLSFGPNFLNIELSLAYNTLFNPFSVNRGGTGLTLLTTYGVLVGSGSLPVNVTAPGTNGQLLIGSTTGNPAFSTVTSTGNTLSFSFGPNSLNIDVNLFGITAFNPFPVSQMGTGQTLLTTYGILIGEGSLNINVTAAGTNGQLLIASTTGDPQFATLSSTGGSITFTFGINSLNIEINTDNVTFFLFFPVPSQGTGRTVLTRYGVLIGEGSLPINVTAAGTDGQLFIASSSGDPAFATITSTGGSLTFAFGTNSLSMDINLTGNTFQLQVGNGGTGLTLLTAYGVLIGEGSLPINVTNPGTNGQVLLASSTGDPAFSTITSTGKTLTFTFGVNSLNMEVDFINTTLFNPLPVENGGTGQTVLTLYGVLIGEGSLDVNVTAAGTNGQTLIASTTGDPSFSTITSTGNTLTFTFGFNSLNIGVVFGLTFFTPLQIRNGGTGLTLLTAYGVLLGAGSLNIKVTDPGTNGQTLIASTGGDPKFNRITSTGGTVTLNVGVNALNMDVNFQNSTFFSPIQVANGGTGRTILTTYGVLIGAGQQPVDVTAPGTNGQIFIGSTGAAPLFTTITSTGNTLTFIFSPNSLRIDINTSQSFFNPLLVPYGGTGKTSLIPYGVLCGGTTSTTAVQSITSVTVGWILKSRGVGLLPVFADPNVPPSFTKINVQAFTSATTSAVYTPITNMQYCIVECIGGGGGGGGAYAKEGDGGSHNESVACGGGGGGGSYSKQTYTYSDILGLGSATVSIAIGTGGTGGSGLSLPALNGGNGGNSTFGNLVGNGGDGGKGAIAQGGIQPQGTSGGTGGLGTGNGNFLLLQGGSPGGNGFSLFSYTTTPTWIACVGGSGGNSQFGGGGQGGALTTGGTLATVSLSSRGGQGTGFGGGGGGSAAYSPSSSTPTAITGANGASGVIIITEYYY